MEKTKQTQQRRVAAADRQSLPAARRSAAQSMTVQQASRARSSPTSQLGLAQRAEATHTLQAVGGTRFSGPVPDHNTVQMQGVEEEELLQGKFAPVQLQGDLEEEELLQGKFDPAQLQGNLEEEELLQGKLDAIQRQDDLDEEEVLQGKPATVQLKGDLEEEELLHGKFAPVQFQGDLEEEELLQGKFANTGTPLQLQPDNDSSENRTGMPDQLKAGLEQLGGVDLSGVRVHYDSAKPAQLGVLAHAQGQNIHIGPSQEKHLPHEGWHSVQQMQGRVKPTLQAKGVSINDDPALENEADLMGAKAATKKSPDPFSAPPSPVTRANPAGYPARLPGGLHASPARAKAVVQRITLNMDPGDNAIDPAALVSQEREKAGKFGNIGQNSEANIFERGQEALPLAGIDPGEPIHIVAHGVPSIGGDEPTVGGMTPAQLFGYLRQLDWTPQHTGNVNLSACTTSWGRRGEPSFARKFADILEEKGFGNTVTGFGSFTVSVDVDTEEEVVPGQREEALALFLVTRLVYTLGEVELHGEGPSKKKEFTDSVQNLYTNIQKEVRLQDEDGWLDTPRTKKITELYMELMKNAGDFLADPSGKNASKIGSDLMNLKRSYTLQFTGGEISHQEAWVEIML